MASYLVTIKQGKAKQNVRKKLLHALEATSGTDLKQISKKPQIWKISSSNGPHSKLFARLRRVAMVAAVFVNYEPQSQSSPAPTLLTLPPEMRNHIYRYSLVEADTIKISSKGRRPSPPGLLQVCRQIRQEAQDIYFSENEFDFIIYKNNASSMISWDALSDLHSDISHMMTLKESANWTNLMVWLEASFEGLTVDWEHDEDPTDDHLHPCSQIVSSLFAMVNSTEAEGLTWQEMSKLLEQVRKAIAVQNPKWGY